MKTFQLTVAAVSSIRALCERSQISHAVVSLRTEFPPLPRGSPVVEAIRVGADVDTLAYLYQSEGHSQAQGRLVATIFSRETVSPADVMTISGIEFCIPASIAHALSPYTLDVDSDGLYFRGADGTKFHY
jgi:hypothetical protein